MPSDMNRRKFLAATGGVALTAGAAATLPQIAMAQTASPFAATQAKGAPAMFKTKPLPFDPQKIKGMSEKMLISHYENNYGGAVKRLNMIAEQLASLDWAAAPGFTVNGLKREELIANNSMLLHELFFDGLGGESEPKGDLTVALTRDFGGYAPWRSQFMAIGKALGGGSGWVLLTYDPRDKRLVNTWAADHTMTLAGGKPILALDMYEHAYHMDYGAKAASYVDAFMNAIRWENAASLYERHSRQA
ncbi:MAG: superoxide dismutase [Proteobacteria bacterium]|nr:superoxide dismutase [Pseudomonadota bacterium]